MLESIDDKILNSVMKRGRGVVFSTEEYAHYGDPDAVQKALSRMARKGVLLRVCHGIYCYPKIDKELGLGQLFPSYEDIAQVIAKRDKVRIFPAGALAQNMLGLSTQVPMNVVYLTDGSNRNPISPRFTQETGIQRQAGYVDHHSLERFGVKQCDRRT